MPAPTLLDVTVRDGSFLIDHQFQPQQAASIAEGLAAAGLEYAEISHGKGVGSKVMGAPGLVEDYDLLEAAREKAPSLKLAVFIPTAEFSLAILPGIFEFIDIGRAGFYPQAVPVLEKISNKLKKAGKRFFAQLVDSPAYPPEIVAQNARTAQDLGADVVYLADSFGSFTPEETERYISAILAEVKIPVGFHGHNSLGMAVPNTVAAWKTGATWLDGSLMGVGKGAGNAVLETLVNYFLGQGVPVPVDLEKICAAALHRAMPVFNAHPSASLADILLAQARIGFEHPDLLKLVSDSMFISLPQLVSRLKAKVGACAQIGDEHLKLIMAEAGQDFDQWTTTLKK